LGEAERHLEVRCVSSDAGGPVSPQLAEAHVVAILTPHITACAVCFLNSFPRHSRNNAPSIFATPSTR
jgi:hypothetical protein